MDAPARGPALPAYTGPRPTVRIGGAGLSPDGVPRGQLPGELRRVRDAGLNAVMIDVVWEVDPVTRSRVAPGPLTVPDADLRRRVAAAHAAGLSVLLHPKITCSGCVNRWRGALRPDDRAAFHASYRAMLERYAVLAAESGVAALFLGSELSSLQTDTHAWRSLARRVRQLYRGTLTYQANWDALGTVAWWDAVDVVSVSAYFPLSDAARPSLSELVAGWHASRSDTGRSRGKRWVEGLHRLAARTRKPVLFGEAGYQSSVYPGRAPYQERETTPFEAAHQATAYRALLEVFSRQPWWLGVVWWEWAVTDAGPTDTDYSPRGKPGERVLRSWYARQH